MEKEKLIEQEAAYRLLYWEKVVNVRDSEYIIETCQSNENFVDFEEKVVLNKLYSYFAENFPLVKKLVSPEFRKILLKKKLGRFLELLDSCYILRTLRTGIFVTDCKKFFANFVDLNDFSLHSTDPGSTFTGLNEKMLILNRLKTLIRQTESIYLDKYSIKLSSLHVYPVKVLIYMGKLLVSPYKSLEIQPRCAECVSKLSSMKKTGILLSCKHTICFECHMQNSSFTCPIDNLRSLQDFPYINLSTFFPTCQGLDSLINCSTVYKLQCGHLTCETCLSNKYCLSCYTSINPFSIKLANKVKDWVDEQILYCDVHNEKAVAFSIEEFRMFCEKCGKNGNIYLKDFPGFEFFDKVFDNEFLELINNEKCQVSEYSVEFLKKCSFFKVLSLRQKYETVRILMDISLDCSSLVSKQEKVEFFSKLYPVHSCSSKVLKIVDQFSVPLKFSSHFMVNGIIVGGKFTVSPHSEKVFPVFFNLKKLEVHCSGQLMCSQESFKPFSGHSVEVSLDPPIKVEPLKSYSFNLQVPSGLYMHGAPFSRLKIPQLSLLSTSNSGSNLIGLILTRI